MNSNIQNIYVCMCVLQEQKIRIIGGKTAEKHLTNSLVITLTNKLGKMLTWDGQRQTEGIKNTIFSDLIIGNVYIYICIFFMYIFV